MVSERQWWCEECINYRDECWHSKDPMELTLWERKTIKGVARAFAWKYSLEAVDLEQELTLRIFKHRKIFKSYVEEGGLHASRKYRRALRNHALDYCKKQVARINGYQSYADYVTVYDKKTVVNALPYVFDHIESVAVLDEFDPTLQTRKSDRQGGLTTRLWDQVDEVRILVTGLRRAFDTIPDRYQKLLFLRYGEDLNYKEIAAILDTTEGAARKATGMALERLRENLGEYA